MSQVPFVIMKPGVDNVATALQNLPAGFRVQAEESGVALNQAIPFGHKFALVPVPAGAPIIKYGQVIGTAAVAIAAGDHVHVHNIRSNRGRGDLASARG